MSIAAYLPESRLIFGCQSESSQAAANVSEKLIGLGPEYFERFLINLEFFDPVGRWHFLNVDKNVVKRCVDKARDVEIEIAGDRGQRPKFCFHPGNDIEHRSAF